MNLLEYVSKTHVKVAKFEYDGQEFDFWYRDLTGAESEIVTGGMGGIMKMIKNQKQDADFMPTEEDLLSMNAQRDLTLWMQLCNEQGERSFPDVDAMKKVIPAKMLDLASKAISKLSPGEAEKNLENLNG